MRFKDLRYGPPFSFSFLFSLFCLLSRPSSLLSFIFSLLSPSFSLLYRNSESRLQRSLCLDIDACRTSKALKVGSPHFPHYSPLSTKLWSRRIIVQPPLKQHDVSNNVVELIRNRRGYDERNREKSDLISLEPIGLPDTVLHNSSDNVRLLVRTPSVSVFIGIGSPMQDLLILVLSMNLKGTRRVLAGHGNIVLGLSLPWIALP